MDNDLKKFLDNFMEHRNEIKETGPYEWSVTPKPGQGVCDFCSGPGPFKHFKTSNFKLETVPGLPDWGSDEDWAACKDCEPFIVNKDKSGLLVRSAEILAYKHGLPIKIAMEAVSKIHNGFWEHKK